MTFGAILSKKVLWLFLGQLLIEDRLFLVQLLVALVLPDASVPHYLHLVNVESATTDG